MNVYRRMAMAVTTCAVGLSLAACTAGITTASRATSPSPTASRAASSSAAAPSHTASTSASPADTVHVNAPIGSFPIPQAAKVVYNISCPKQVSIILSPVTPSQASTFYTTALPRAGYKVTSNIASSDPNTGAPMGLVAIEFTGHGYTGTIITMANLSAEASAAPSIGIGSLPSSMTKNVAEITMSAHGTPESYICPT